MSRYVHAIRRLFTAASTDSRVFRSLLNCAPEQCKAVEFSRGMVPPSKGTAASDASDNPLWTFFQNRREGRGIWKWEHYFEIYHRHLSRFVGQRVDLLEIGIFSGGSLDMWRSYFGDRSHIYGIDIEEACRSYASDHVSVFIGDQADRSFWSGFRAAVPGVDVVIDDGGHTPEQQLVTLEETLPHLRPGGVYICEDIHGSFNRFAAYAAALTMELNRTTNVTRTGQECDVTAFQQAVHSIHFYPFVVVIEKHAVPPQRLVSPRHGTEWQPFL